MTLNYLYELKVADKLETQLTVGIAVGDTKSATGEPEQEN